MRSLLGSAAVFAINASFRDESLNETLLSFLTQAKAEITAWTEDYNQNRGHSSLGNIPQRICIENRSGKTGRMRPD